jgi:neutral amino acid transport system substrate-binding protein
MKTVFNSRWRGAIVIALSASLLAACESQTPTDTTAAGNSGGDTLKLGALLPATGDLSSIGEAMPEAAKLAVETINACGGVNDNPVQLVIEDSQTDPNAGAAAMTKLAEVDQVAGVVGAFASSVSGAAVDVAARNQVMMVSPGSTSPVFTERAQAGEFNGYWARTAPPDTYQAQALAKLASERGFDRVSTVVINNDYGVGFEQAFVQAFEELGGTVVNGNNPVRYDPKATTLDSEAAAAFGGKPDAVAAVLYDETGSLLLKSAYQQGLSDGVTVMLTDGVYSESFTERVGKDNSGQSIISGALGTVPGADGAALADFSTRWQEATGRQITAFVPHTWDATVLMMLAAEAADENTGAAIQSNIRDVANAPGTEVSDPCEAMELVRAGEEINYQGASGNVDIDEYGDVVGSYDVWTVEEAGTLKVVDKVNPGK